MPFLVLFFFFFFLLVHLFKGEGFFFFSHFGNGCAHAFAHSTGVLILFFSSVRWWKTDTRLFFLSLKKSGVFLFFSPPSYSKRSMAWTPILLRFFLDGHIITAFISCIQSAWGFFFVGLFSRSIEFHFWTGRISFPLSFQILPFGSWPLATSAFITLMCSLLFFIFLKMEYHRVKQTITQLI